MDVLAGTIIGLVSAFMLAPMVLRMQESRESFLAFTAIYGIICAAVSILTAILLDMGIIEALAFSDLSSNTAIAAGALIGGNIEKRYVDFTSDGSRGKKIARYLAGAVSAIAVTVILIMLPLPHYSRQFLAFAGLGLWVTAGYPAIAVKLGLMERA